MPNTADVMDAAVHAGRRNAPSPLLETAAFGTSTSVSGSTGLDRALAAARPRLMRLAYASGVAPDEVDDAVQEALVVAWRRLDHLRSPERFDAWLDAICRHVCQHQVRKRRSITARQMTVADLLLICDGPDETLGSRGITGESFDPAEELQRQDLENLLHPALKQLPPSARQAARLCHPWYVAHR